MTLYHLRSAPGKWIFFQKKLGNFPDWRTGTVRSSGPSRSGARRYEFGASNLTAVRINCGRLCVLSLRLSW
jgi:hypothetical protein